MTQPTDRPDRADLQARAAHKAEIVERARSEMAEMGVDALFIDRLVETFYSHVRAHPTLGPVFDQRLSGRWPEHMVKMKAFWSSVAFKTGAYGGKPVMAHQGVDGMSEALFADWLKLFAATLQELEASPKAKAWFLASAERIAKSLILSLFYNPAFDDPRQRQG